MAKLLTVRGLEVSTIGEGEEALKECGKNHTM